MGCCTSGLEVVEYGLLIFLFQGIKDKDHRFPEDLERIFSEATLRKLGLTDYHLSLYTKKMEKIIEAPTIVSYLQATLLYISYLEVIFCIRRVMTSCF